MSMARRDKKEKNQEMMMEGREKCGGFAAAEWWFLATFRGLEQSGCTRSAVSSSVRMKQ
jgi:hypothetical protein